MPKVQHTEKQLSELSVFGWFPGGRPILARHWDGEDACKRCNGFGTYGVPMCGAVYTCVRCHGSGKISFFDRWLSRLKSWFGIR